MRNVDHLYVFDAESHDLTHRRSRKRLERACNSRLAIENFRRQHFRCELLFADLLAQLQSLDIVKKFDDLFVGAISEGPKKSRREEFSAAFAAIEIDVKKIAGVELHFDPGTAVRNDAEAVKNFAVQMDARFERDTRGTMQLADNHALRAVDDKSSLRRHERDFAHVNFFFFDALFFAQLKSHVERRAIGLPFALRFKRSQFWLADFVMTKIKNRLFVVAFDREDFLENGLQPGVFPFCERHVLLQKLDV